MAETPFVSVETRSPLAAFPLPPQSPPAAQPLGFEIMRTPANIFAQPPHVAGVGGPNPPAPFASVSAVQPFAGSVQFPSPSPHPVGFGFGMGSQVAPAAGGFGAGVSFLELMASVSSTDSCIKPSNPSVEQGDPFPDPLLRHEIHGMAEKEPGCNNGPSAYPTYSAIEKEPGADSDWDGAMDVASEDDDGDDEFSDDDDNVLYDSEFNGNQYSLENQEITVGYCSAGDGPAVRNKEQAQEDSNGSA